MRNLNFALTGFWLVMGIIHVVAQHPAAWWVAAPMSIALAIYALKEALDD